MDSAFENCFHVAQRPVAVDALLERALHGVAHVGERRAARDQVLAPARGRSVRTCEQDPLNLLVQGIEGAGLVLGQRWSLQTRPLARARGVYLSEVPI